MSRDTGNSFFIVSSVPRLYQQLLKGLSSYQSLARTILGNIKTAYDFRQIERVRELSRILIHIPIREYQLIGEYYWIWCECRESRLHTKPLERVIGQTQTYKAQALLSRGTFEIYKGEPEAALYFYIEGLKASRSVSDYIGLSLAIAQLKSIEGFHGSSLSDLENLVLIIKHAEPRLYFDFLNSYAVEIDKAGRTQEARSIIKPVVASPFAPAYPAWQETARELKEPDRSLVTVPLIKHEPVKVKQHASKEVKTTSPDRVVYFPLREAPEPKRPEAINQQELAGMTVANKKEYILSAVRTELLHESEYDRLIYLLGLIEVGSASDVIDLEDKALLHHLIEVWCDAIDPGELAGVISALRDCKDDQRREDIMDDMIMFAYQHTPNSKESESQWRRKVERRLPEM